MPRCAATPPVRIPARREAATQTNHETAINLEVPDDEIELSDSVAEDPIGQTLSLT